MMRALMLIVDGSRTWEAIKVEKPTVGRITAGFFLPLLLLTSVGEAAGLMFLGMDRGGVLEKVEKISGSLAARYECGQAALTLLILYGGAAALRQIGASFHRRHSYTECFTTLAYSLSPLLLLRLLNGVPAIHTWVSYGIGIFISLTLLYRGIPFIMRPDPSSALGLFMFCSFVLVGTTGLAHFLATQVLAKRIFAWD